MSTPDSKPYIVTSVKFIVRMQWIACGDYYNGYITVYTYADNRLTEIKKFQAEDGPVHALAVHPTLPCLLSCSKNSVIKLWDWDQGWMCTRKFSCTRSTHQMTFNPKHVNSFVSLDYHGDINVCC
jgi:coatomer subunit beta'